MFHRGVVVCEGDSDVRFYEAVLHRLEDRGQLSAAPDLYFVHGGGKGELPTLVGAYKSLQTQTAVIADIDLLRNENDVKRVLSALGADIDQWQGAYRSIVSALSERPPITNIPDLIARVRAILDEIENQSPTPHQLDSEKRRQLQVLIENAASWSEAKRHGIRKLLGGVRVQAQSMFAEWRRLGLFIVPVGELEGWWPEGPAGNKNEWIVRAVDQLAEPNSLPDVDGFLSQICEYFGHRVSAPARIPE